MVAVMKSAVKNLNHGILLLELVLRRLLVPDGDCFFAPDVVDK
jgi:hypothetical protein